MKNNKDMKQREILTERIVNHNAVFYEILQEETTINAIVSATSIVFEAISNGGALYLCGNGGSAADSQHIAAEFVSRFYRERKAINAEALTTNTSSLTAIGNDYDFDCIFVRQLEAKAHRGDVLVGISTSGTSRNVIKAIEYAAQNGIHTILLTGANDNKYDSSIYECVIRIPSDDTPRIQEAHIFVGHYIAECVEAAMCGEI